MNWVARFEGAFDIGFTIRVKKIAELDAFLSDLRHRFHRYLTNLTLAVNIEVDFLGRFISGNTTSRNSRGASYTTPVKESASVDEIDTEILRRLALDPRCNRNQMAEQLNTSVPTIRKRIRQLELNGIIKRYSVLLDHRKLGLTNFYVFLYLNQVSQKRLNALVASIKEIPEMVYVVKALGEWNYELNIEAESYERYHQLMMSLQQEHQGVIRDYAGFPVSEVTKLTLSP